MPQLVASPMMNSLEKDRLKNFRPMVASDDDFRARGGLGATYP